jgi:signal peptidase II
VFNLADSAIVCGGVIGAFLALRGVDFDGVRHGRASTSPSEPAPPVTMDP